MLNDLARPTGIPGIEDTEHFLLLCPCFDVQRRDLLAGIYALILRPLGYVDLADEFLLQLLLYGDEDFLPQ